MLLPLLLLLLHLLSHLLREWELELDHHHPTHPVANFCLCFLLLLFLMLLHLISIYIICKKLNVTIEFYIIYLLAPRPSLDLIFLQPIGFPLLLGKLIGCGLVILFYNLQSRLDYVLSFVSYLMLSTN